MSKFRNKKVQKGAADAFERGESDLSYKDRGFGGRKLPNREEAIGRTDKANIKIRKADQVSASFAMRARQAKNKS